MRILLTAMDTGQTSDVIALLASHRFVLDRASNGEEALQFARLYSFDAVLFNASMNDPVCTEFVRRLRATGLREGRRYRCDRRGCFGTFLRGRRRVLYGLLRRRRYLGVQVWPNP